MNPHRSTAERAFAFDEALDEYLHVIVRTRPWTKKAQEDILSCFGIWLEERSGPEEPPETVLPPPIPSGWLPLPPRRRPSRERSGRSFARR